MNKYLLHGKLSAKSGHGDELAEILIQASKLVSTAKGCKLYVVSRDNNVFYSPLVRPPLGLSKLIIFDHCNRHRCWNVGNYKRSES